MLNYGQFKQIEQTIRALGADVCFYLNFRLLITLFLNQGQGILLSLPVGGTSRIQQCNEKNRNQNNYNPSHSSRLRLF